MRRRLRTSVLTAFGFFLALAVVLEERSLKIKGTPTKAFMKGVESRKKETLMKKEAAKHSQPNGGGNQEVEYKPLATGPSNDGQKEDMMTAEPEEN